ncbi:helix-turn-helix domain-containing protein [Cohnella rhizosphaerae]|uniref:DNA-binding response regulator n=1 Tax=Cohnella rhizosphaerae TaxID=1457232 RepID=A0A9X4QTL8_9BACL|nr:DNA-binding response regulator [Cohnella rhizosphaerae]MDG0810835.1 DNA-binding response regulator [Cohnella rhizosphaerae]
MNMNSNPAFERAYDEMMERAIKASSGERKRRLLLDRFNEKLLAQNVWWEVRGDLKGLIPEMEIKDLKDGTRFSDYGFLYPIPRPNGLLMEADAFGTHLRDVSRWKYADDLERQNHLLIDGWRLLRFSRDDMIEKPRRCQQTLLAALSAWGFIAPRDRPKLNVYERAILHYAREQTCNVKIGELVEQLQVSYRSIGRHTLELEQKGLLILERSAGGRIMKLAPVRDF